MAVATTDITQKLLASTVSASTLDADTISFHIGSMDGDRKDRDWTARLALSASAGVHLLIAAVLIFGLPAWPQQPQKEEAIKVDLVPPPKPPEKPKAKPPEQKPPEQKKAEKPPEAKPAPPPPPPASQAGKDAAQQTTMPAQKPVFQFGDKDAGPRKALDGDSAEDGATATVEKQYPEKQEPAQQPKALDAAGGKSEASQPPAPEEKKPDQAKSDEGGKPQQTRPDKKLFSRSATGDEIATTAMGGVPRSVRGGKLCETALREQLERASPPYFPSIVPSYRLTEGTVINVSRGNLLIVGGQWRNLSFRCEVDANATKIVSFGFKVGDQIPRSEYESRRIPVQ